MARSALFPIILGTMFIALGMMPGVIEALMQELEDFRRIFSLEPPRSIQVDDGAGLWLVVGGGVMVIGGLVALVAR